MQTSIVIRTFVADGRRLTLHVGGGITWKSDPAAEWDETVTKARGPLGAIGAVEVGMSGPGTPRSGEVGHVWVDGRLLPADGSHVSVFDRGFQLGDGVFETLRVRGAHPTELAEHVARLRRSAAGLDIPLPADLERRLVDGIADLLAAEGLDGPTGDASVRITVSRGPFRGRGLLPPDEVVEADHRDPGVAGPAAARPSISSAASTSSRRPCAATRPTRSPRSRRPHAPTTSTPGWRRAAPAPTTPCS